MSEFIPYGRQDINDEDVKAVLETLVGDFLTTGPTVAAFEDAVATAVSAKHAVAMNSATSALHVAYMALGIGENDIVWTCPNTFVATSNAALYCGATVDFVDMDPQTYVMSTAALEAKLKLCAPEDRPTLVVPVHFAGQSADMKSIARLAKEYKFKVVEDASHAVGGSYDGEMVGCCTYSDICIFSFHPVKIITTAEGGMALTNDPDLALAMQELRSHGITRNPDRMTEASHGDWYYQQIGLGYNYRLTDLQAALGLSQLKRLPEFIAKRRALVENYRRLLANLPIICPAVAEDCDPSWHLFCIQLPENMNRRQVFDSMRAANIGVQVLYIPIHLQPYYRGLGFKDGMYPVSEAYYKRSFALPMYAGLEYEQQEYVIDQFSRILL